VAEFTTVRKEELEDYAGYQFTQGVLSGAAVATAAAGLGDDPVFFGLGIGFVVAAVAHSIIYSNRFKRIRKAIDDSGGDA